MKKQVTWKVNSFTLQDILKNAESVNFARRILKNAKDVRSLTDEIHANAPVGEKLREELNNGLDSEEVKRLIFEEFLAEKAVTFKTGDVLKLWVKEPTDDKIVKAFSPEEKILKVMVTIPIKGMIHLLNKEGKTSFVLGVGSHSKHTEYIPSEAGQVKATLLTEKLEKLGVVLEGYAGSGFEAFYG